MTDGAPGAFSLTAEDAQGALNNMTHFPTAQFSSLTETATLVHALNANTFTGAAYRFADAKTAEDAVGHIKQELLVNTQFMCGFPETLVIISAPGNYLVVMFGNSEIITAVSKAATEAIDGSAVVVNEPF